MFETISKALSSQYTTSALSPTSKTGTYLPAPGTPAESCTSECTTHAQQVAHLYLSACEAGVPMHSLLGMVLNKLEELFVPALVPAKRGSKVTRTLRKLDRVLD
jgi:hypothetical protein